MNFKKSLIALAITSTLGVSAYATESKHPKPEAVPLTINTSTSAESSSRSGAEANSQANSAAHSTSNSESTSSATSGDSNSSAVSGGNTFSNTTTYKQKRQSPAVYTAATNTTAACQGEWHVGASAIGSGISFGKSRTIRDCVLAMAANEEADRGNARASILLRCRISFYKEALGEDCEALLNTQDGSGYTKEEVAQRTLRRTPEQRKADREKLLQEVSK